MTEEEADQGSNTAATTTTAATEGATADASVSAATVTAAGGETEGEHTDALQGESLNAAEGSRVSSYRSSTNSLSPIQIVIHVPDSDPDSDHSAGSNNVQNHHISFDRAAGPSAAAVALSKTPSGGSSKSHSPPAAASAAAASAGMPPKSPARTNEPVETKGCCIVS